MLIPPNMQMVVVQEFLQWDAIRKNDYPEKYGIMVYSNEVCLYRDKYYVSFQSNGELLGARGIGIYMDEIYLDNIHDKESLFNYIDEYLQ